MGADEGLDPETLEFLSKLESFFANPDFTDALREFFSTHVPAIEFKSYEEEQPLQNHDIYRQYTTMVEQKLEKFMEEEGLSPDSIFAACEKATASGEARWLTCLDYLNACTEYNAFIDLAFDHACMLGLGDPDSDEAWGEDNGDEEA